MTFGSRAKQACGGRLFGVDQSNRTGSASRPLRRKTNRANPVRQSDPSGTRHRTRLAKCPPRGARTRTPQVNNRNCALQHSSESRSNQLSLLRCGLWQPTLRGRPPGQSADSSEPTVTATRGSSTGLLLGAARRGQCGSTDHAGYRSPWKHRTNIRRKRWMGVTDFAAEQSLEVE